VGLAVGLEFILPHHTFDRTIGLIAVLRIFLLIVRNLNGPFYRKIDELSDRHALIHFYRLFYRDLERPVAAKSYITLSGGRVNIDAQSSGRGLSF